MAEHERKIYEDIVDDLMGKIQSGELTAGMRLPAERKLAAEYGVSRPVVREAFRSMERMGCVESYVGGGTFVKRPELSDVIAPYSILFLQDEGFSDELLETRMILETGVARLAVRRCTEEQLQEMTDTLDEMETDIAGGGTGEKADIRFHEELVEATGNRALKLVISTCAEVLNRTIPITQSVVGVPEQALQDHRRILKAISERNGQEAEQSMREHLQNAQKNLKRAQKEKALKCPAGGEGE